MARPTKYRPEYVDQVEKLSLLGLTDAEMATYFEINEDTFNTWKKRYPEFSESIKKGKAASDGDVVKSLFKRALGYKTTLTKQRPTKEGIATITEEQEFPPDVTACIFWLKNRQPKLWRDKPQESQEEQDNGNMSDLIEALRGTCKEVWKDYKEE